jgi:hypothetical protein
MVERERRESTRLREDLHSRRSGDGFGRSAALKKPRLGAETECVEIPQQRRKASRMSAKTPPRPAAPGAPADDDRGAATSAAPKRGSLRWVRNVLGRSIRLEQRNNQLHVALVDPRRPVPEEAPMSLLMQQRAELGARLLVHDPAIQIVRHLFMVHDELRSGGWAAVEALPAKVLERGLTEAEILASHEPSDVLATIIETLRGLKTAAETRAALEAAEAEWEVPKVPEVSDTNFDEYELMERSWAGTVPAGLEIRGRNSRM